MRLRPPRRSHASLSDSSALRSAIEIAGAASGSSEGNADPPVADPAKPVARKADMQTDADESVLGRACAGRLQAHEPIYFVY